MKKTEPILVETKTFRDSIPSFGIPLIPDRPDETVLWETIRATLKDGQRYVHNVVSIEIKKEKEWIEDRLNPFFYSSKRIEKVKVTESRVYFYTTIYYEDSL